MLYTNTLKFSSIITEIMYTSLYILVWSKEWVEATHYFSYEIFVAFNFLKDSWIAFYMGYRMRWRHSLFVVQPKQVDFSFCMRTNRKNREQKNNVYTLCIFVWDIQADIWYWVLYKHYFRIFVYCIEME